MIEQRRLGSTGLSVSRLALGMMSFGDTSRRQWVLDEAAAEPIVRRAIEGGITFFDTADMYAAGASEGRHRPDPAEADLARRSCRSRPRSTTRRPQGRTAAVSRASTCSPRSTPRWRGCRWTTSTCTRSTAGIPRRRSRRRWKRCTTSSRRAKRATSAPAQWLRGSSRRAQAVAERHGWTQFVSMQNHYNLLHREEEREMIPLCVDQGIAVDSLQPARTWVPRAGCDIPGRWRIGAA